MQRRGRDPEEESRKPAKEDRKMEGLDRQEAAKPPAPDAETILRQAAYVPSAEVEAALDDAFAGFLAGQRPDASSPGLLLALAQDNPAGSPFLDLLAVGLGGGDRDALRAAVPRRPQERRVGKGCDSTGRYQWEPTNK